jgi:hypothetical protein
MKPEDIKVGCKYSNPTEKYGGTRVVDRFVTRLDGTVAVCWKSAEKTSGHDSGVAKLKTFANWARRTETMSTDDLAAHNRRATAHATADAKYGQEVREFLLNSDQKAPLR